MKLVSIDRIRELLDYDPETGKFFWRTSKGHVAAGSVAGTKSSNGYLKIGIDGRQYYSHRLAWVYVHGVWPEHEIDHINGIRADNRIENLREASRQENMQNGHSALKSGHSSGLRGVTWDKARGMWKAAVSHGNRHVFAGRFASCEDAHEAYLAKKRELHPFADSIKIKGPAC